MKKHPELPTKFKETTATTRLYLKNQDKNTKAAEIEYDYSLCWKLLLPIHVIT